MNHSEEFLRKLLTDGSPERERFRELAETFLRPKAPSPTHRHKKRGEQRRDGSYQTFVAEPHICDLPDCLHRERLV